MKDSLKKQLMINYLLGICTSREQEAVEKWLDEDPENISLLQHIAKEMSKDQKFALPEKGDVKREVMRQIGEKASFAQKKGLPFSAGREPESSAQKSTRLWLKVAAMLLAVSMASVLSFYFGGGQSPEMAHEVNMKQSTMSYGQTATLHFGDGSEIQMNSGSTLRYPETFGPDERKVYLEGEAFFTIELDETRPFIVRIGNTSVRVLGTSFNIRAYGNEDEIQVAVAEGRVSVTQIQADTESVQSDENILLEKNQWLTFRSAGRIMEKGEGDISEMIAWKDRVLVFSNKSFAEVAVMLERWYGVGIVIEDENLKSQILEGEHRDVSLEEVLSSLQLAMNFEYDFDENNKVRIY